MMFLYLMLGIWVLLGLSIVLTAAALLMRSWKIMLLSCIVSLPNTYFVLSRPVAIFMYWLLIWFLIQLVLLIWLLVKKMLLSSDDSHSSR